MQGSPIQLHVIGLVVYQIYACEDSQVKMKMVCSVLYILTSSLCLNFLSVYLYSLYCSAWEYHFFDFFLVLTHFCCWLLLAVLYVTIWPSLNSVSNIPALNSSVATTISVLISNFLKIFSFSYFPYQLCFQKFFYSTKWICTQNIRI